jgi:hypothetical protein
MKKTMYTITVALLLLLAGTVGAVAAPVTSTAGPANAASQDVVDQLEAARLQQVLALIQAGQPAEVEFAGMLQPAGLPGQWAVGGLFLGQTGATVFDGLPAAGLHAHVRAEIRNNGTVQALYVHTIYPSGGSRLYENPVDWMRADHGIHFGPGKPAQMPADQVVANRRAAPPAAVQLPATPTHHPTPVPAQPPAPSQPGTHRGDDCSHDDHMSGHH